MFQSRMVRGGLDVNLAFKSHEKSVQGHTAEDMSAHPPAILSAFSPRSPGNLYGLFRYISRSKHTTKTNTEATKTVNYQFELL